MNLAQLDALLLVDGRLRLLCAEDLRALAPRETLRAWCGMRGRYLLPTVELVDWLHTQLGRRDGWPYDNVLEIGAGMGDLGRALDVRMTDSGVQERAEMKLLYAMLGQTTTAPPKDVEKLDALAAAKKYKPHTILAAWVTQKYQPHDETRRIGSCVFGVDENHLLRLCKRYLFIGNERVHGDKRILSEPHETFRPPWIVSRAERPELDVIWIWNR